MIVPDWAAYLRFRPQFIEALDREFYPIEYLDDLLLQGRARLFVSEHAAMVAELKAYPGGAKVCNCLAACGRLEETTDVIRPEVEAWGREMGCTKAMVESREGWVRVLKPHGYSIWQVSVVKDL